MKIVWILLAVVAVGLIVWFFVIRSKSDSESSISNPVPSSNQSVQNSPLSGQAVVSVQNLSFEPVNLEIAKGSKVVWTNNDSVTHNINADNGIFSSNQLQKGDKFEFTFNETGEYSYHCGIHPNMKAKIVVK